MPFFCSQSNQQVAGGVEVCGKPSVAQRMPRPAAAAAQQQQLRRDVAMSPRLQRSSPSIVGGPLQRRLKTNTIINNMIMILFQAADGNVDVGVD